MQDPVSDLERRCRRASARRSGNTAPLFQGGSGINAYWFGRRTYCLSFHVKPCEDVFVCSMGMFAALVCIQPFEARTFVSSCEPG